MLSLSSNAELSIIIIKYKPPQSKDFQGHLKLVESQLLSLYTIIHFFLWRIKQTWSMHTLCPEDVKLITIWGIVILEAEKAMATHSSTLAWKIPQMEEPGRLQSMGSLGVRHDWATSLSLFTFMHWRRKCQPTPVSLPGKSQGQGNLVGCHLWRHTEPDTTEAT